MSGVAALSVFGVSQLRMRVIAKATSPALLICAINADKASSRAPRSAILEDVRGCLSRSVGGPEGVRVVPDVVVDLQVDRNVH